MMSSDMLVIEDGWIMEHRGALHSEERRLTTQWRRRYSASCNPQPWRQLFWPAKKKPTNKMKCLKHSNVTWKRRVMLHSGHKGSTTRWTRKIDWWLMSWNAGGIRHWSAYGKSNVVSMSTRIIM